jgi:hypothetical protein
MRRLTLCAVACLALLGATSALAAPAGGSASSASALRRASTSSCRKASARFAAARRNLRKLRASGASAAARRQANRKLENAFRAIERACGARFDVTGVDASFDATVNVQDHMDSCSTVFDAHWTAALGPGAEPAVLDVFSVDGRGRPSYQFGADVPLVEHGSGTLELTCNEPSPGSNGTATCTFKQDPGGELSILTDTGKRLDPQTLTWVFGYNGFSYSRPGNGGSCSYSGARPPYVEPSDYSPTLFVSPINDGSNGLEPTGVTTVPAANFAHSLSLGISGSASKSLDSTLDSSTFETSWHLSLSLHRRG